MERMLRKKKDNSEYEIDRELTGKFAIEKNAEYQDRIAELEEENKKLKEENEYRKSIVDIIPEGEGNVAEETIKDLQDRIKELKEEIRFLEQCLDNKEKVNKSLREELSAYDREYFDEDKKAEHIFMGEDTLQELRDLGKI